MLANTIQVRDAIRKAAANANTKLGMIWTNKSRKGGDLRFIGAEVFGGNAGSIAIEVQEDLQAQGFSNNITFTVGDWADYVRADAVLA